MRIISAQQVETIDWSADASTYFVAALGYESRARFAAETILALDPECNRHAFGFAERKVLARDDNKHAFERLRFDITDDVPSKDGTVLGEYVKRLLLSSPKNKINLVVDYSCMSKTWYAEIIRMLSESSLTDRSVSVYFTYSPAKYTPPGSPGTNRVAGAISGFCHLAPPTFPTALILGLGYEAVRATGLRDYLDPKETFAFYTDPSLEELFTKTVIKNNRALLSTLGRDTAFPHPLADLDYTSALLANLTQSLNERYRVVIAPLGPKPFCLLSLLLSAETKSVDVWRVSGAEHSTPEERKAFGKLLIYCVRYGNSP